MPAQRPQILTRSQWTRPTSPTLTSRQKMRPWTLWLASVPTCGAVASRTSLSAPTTNSAPLRRGMLVAIRDGLGLTVAERADELRISRRTLGRWVSGATPIPPFVADWLDALMQEQRDAAEYVFNWIEDGHRVDYPVDDDELVRALLPEGWWQPPAQWEGSGDSPETWRRRSGGWIRATLQLAVMEFDADILLPGEYPDRLT